MKKKHTKILSAILTLTMLAGLFLPAFAEGEATTPVDETTPVVQSIDINANYYAGDTEGSYSIIFTVMEEIPAFTQLSFKIQLDGASVNEASFDSAVLADATNSVARYEDYATYTLTYESAKKIPQKTKLCHLTITSAEEPSSDILSFDEFSIIKEGESEPTALTAELTIEEGPIIPELDAKTQAVYDAICALPDPMTLSFYQENGKLTDLESIKETVTNTKAAHTALSNAQENDLNAVLEFNDKSTYALETLPSVIQGMQNIRGLVEIAAATKDITEDNALSYQFLITVFEAHSSISLQGLLPDSSARREASQLLGTLNDASDLLHTALASAEAESDGGCKTKTYACQTQLTRIQSLSGHNYYSEYMADLEDQIETLIDEVESTLTSDPIMQKGLLDTLESCQATIELIKQGISDLPTMKVDGINLRSRYTISFKRKKVLDDSLAVSISVVVSDKNGKEIDSAEKTFEADDLELSISFSASASKYTKGELYTVTAYYHVNGAKYLIDSQNHESYYIRTTQSTGLGGGGNSSGNINTNTDEKDDTPSTGGTIFPDSNDEPEPPAAPETIFEDIKNYSWATEAINTLYEVGIINGMEEGIFNPAGQVTREQFCKMVVSLFEIPTKTAASAFGDVKENAWYAPYITAAVEAGYVQGQSNDYFGIGESIMRQDMAVILYRALGDQNSKAILNFSDKENIASYAEDAIAELVGLNIINGYEDGSFQPRGTATRAEAAKMIYGIYQYLNN